MQFTYPQFLWALLALSIPIIIHLFRFRRYKRLLFPNVKFLKEIKEDTSANRRIKHLLVLLSRLLAVACLVFAFAKPFIPVGQEVQSGKKAVSVYVDNSFSMKALSEDIPLIDKAKKQAQEIIKAYAVDDDFQILTNDLEGRHQRIISQEEALNFIDEIEESPSVKPLQLIVDRMSQTLNRSENDQKIQYLISDFQESISDFTDKQDTTFQYNLVPIRSVEQNNVTIDSVWLGAPTQLVGQTATCILRIQNYGETAAEQVQVTYSSNNQTKPVGTISIPANGSVIDSFNIPILEAGWQTGTFSVGDYPIQFDDKMYVTFNVSEEIKVLTIDEVANKFIKSAYAGAKSYNVSSSKITNLNFASFNQYNLIILNEPRSISSGLATELDKFLKNGGNLIVFPNARADISSYNNFFQRIGGPSIGAFENTAAEVADISKQDFLFNDVFKNTNSRLALPKVKGYFPVENVGKAGQPLVRFRNGKTFLQKDKIGEGQLFLCTSPLDKAYSDFVNNGPIFVPFLFKAAIYKGKTQKIAHFIGSNELIEIPHQLNSNERVYKLKSEDNEFIPQQTVSGSKVIFKIGNNLKSPNHYSIEDGAGKQVHQLAYNYNRLESNLALATDEYLQKQLQFNILDQSSQQNIGQTIGERSQGKPLWRLFLIGVLIFLFVEVLLLRFWRN